MCSGALDVMSQDEGGKMTQHCTAQSQQIVKLVNSFETSGEACKRSLLQSTWSEERSKVGVSLMKLWLMVSWFRHLFLTRKLKGLFRPMMYFRGGKTCTRRKLSAPKDCSWDKHRSGIDKPQMPTQTCCEKPSLFLRRVLTSPKAVQRS